MILMTFSRRNVSVLDCYPSKSPSSGHRLDDDTAGCCIDTAGLHHRHRAGGCDRAADHAVNDGNKQLETVAPSWPDDAANGLARIEGCCSRSHRFHRTGQDCGRCERVLLPETRWADAGKRVWRLEVSAGVDE